MTNMLHKKVRQVTGAQCAPNCCLFSKIKTKPDDGNVSWWIFGNVSLLKLEKDVEDDNRYCVLQIDIVSNRHFIKCQEV